VFFEEPTKKAMKAEKIKSVWHIICFFVALCVAHLVCMREFQKKRKISEETSEETPACGISDQPMGNTNTSNPWSIAAQPQDKPIQALGVKHPKRTRYTQSTFPLEPEHRMIREPPRMRQDPQPTNSIPATTENGSQYKYPFMHTPVSNSDWMSTLLKVEEYCKGQKNVGNIMKAVKDMRDVLLVLDCVSNFCLKFALLLQSQGHTSVQNYLKGLLTEEADKAKIDRLFAYAKDIADEKEKTVVWNRAMYTAMEMLMDTLYVQCRKRKFDEISDE